ncbi:hypothetical protein B2J88_21135 [Rhodococcus sp. SRB_17]|uniref:hypothetical protein n=1 Tax=unclassified Acidovorax TaxID=2684926 RepID=UPI00145F33CE|nr:MULTISPECIES: hypothetical protein [unclassified Acidovorax]NMM86843.1 hypothetical protein [Rhodococcus sp. SRB_17]
MVLLLVRGAGAEPGVQGAQGGQQRLHPSTLCLRRNVRKLDFRPAGNLPDGRAEPVPCGLTAGTVTRIVGLRA